LADIYFEQERFKMSDVLPEQQGSLERLGIPLETNPVEGVLTPASVKAARFRMSKPSGYAVKDVEDFILNIIQPTLEWYVQMLHQRDLAVHKLGAELDRTEVDLLNARYQIQSLEYGVKVQDGIALNQDDKEMSELLGRFKELETKYTEAAAMVEKLTKYSAEQDAYIDQILAEVGGGETAPAVEPSMASQEPDIELEAEEPVYASPAPVQEVTAPAPAAPSLPAGIRPDDL
jgi:hypothetical protein